MNSKNKLEQKFYERMKVDEIESNVNEVHTGIQPTAMELAEQCAKQQKPKLKGGKLAPIISGLTSAYKELGANLSKNLQTGMEDIYNLVDTEKVKKLIDKNFQKLKQLGGGKQILEIEIKRLSVGYGILQHRLTLMLMNLLISLEVIVDFSALSAMGDSALLSIGYSLGCGIVVGIQAHFFRTLVMLGKNKWQKIAISSFISFIFFGLFWLISSFRVQAGQLGLDLESTNYHNVGRWGFIAFNMLFFWSASLLSFKLPTKEEKQKMAKRQKMESELATVNAEIKILEDENAKEQNILDEKKRMREMAIQYEQKLFAWIETLYLKTVSLFITECTIKRNDGTPDCFNDIDTLAPLFPNRKSKIS